MKLWDVLKPATRLRAVAASAASLLHLLAPALYPLGWLLMLLVLPAGLFVALALDFDPYDKEKDKMTEAAKRCNQTLFLLSAVVFLALIAGTLYQGN